jgi:hypothetical protein
MKSQFTVIVLALGLLEGTPANYAFGQKTDKISEEKPAQDKADRHQMGPDKMGANAMAGGSISPDRNVSEKKPKKARKSGDGKTKRDRVSGDK